MDCYTYTGTTGHNPQLLRCGGGACPGRHREPLLAQDYPPRHGLPGWRLPGLDQRTSRSARPTHDSINMHSATLPVRSLIVSALVAGMLAWPGLKAKGQLEKYSKLSAHIDSTVKASDRISGYFRTTPGLAEKRDKLLKKYFSGADTIFGFEDIYQTDRIRYYFVSIWTSKFFICKLFKFKTKLYVINFKPHGSKVLVKQRPPEFNFILPPDTEEYYKFLYPTFFITLDFNELVFKVDSVPRIGDSANPKVVFLISKGNIEVRHWPG